MVYLDFEHTLMKAMKLQFPKALLISWLFYFEQAIQRHLIDLRIKTEQVKIAMIACCTDNLTVMLKKEAKKKGLPHIKHLIEEAYSLAEDDKDK